MKYNIDLIDLDGRYQYFKGYNRHYNNLCKFTYHAHNAYVVDKSEILQVTDSIRKLFINSECKVLVRLEL